jgi:hypothetical protein
MREIPPEVDAALQAYVAGARRLFAEDLIGVYVHGSLAYDEFDAEASDVDLVVVHRADLTDVQRRALSDLHAHLLAAHPAAARLDGTYAPLHAVGTYGTAVCPSFRDGRFLARRGGDLNPVAWHTLHTRGLVLCGPSASEVVPPVSGDALRENMWRNIAFLRRRMPFYVLGGTTNTVFGVLTLCRVLYTLRTGEIASKRMAARWALRHVAACWRPLLRRALTRYGHDDSIDLVLAAGAVPFAAYVAHTAGRDSTA